MFRQMRRIKQQISKEECIRILKEEPRGVLAVLGDDGYPYTVPLDHWYCEENGKLYFHCAKEGHKIDAIKKCNKVSYCVMDKGYKNPGEWAINFNSVVVFGKMSFVEDDELTLKICIDMSRKFTDDEEYIKKEIRDSLAHVLCLELTPEHISGKLVNEA